MNCEFCGEPVHLREIEKGNAEIVEVQANCPVEERLDYLREEIENERISMGELIELQGLGDMGLIPEGDLLLREWAGIPENQPMNLPKEIMVHGRRWRDQFNTYHSVMVEADGKVVGIEPFSYGYGDQYQETGLEILIAKGVIPKLTYDNGFSYGLRRTCEALEIELTTEVYDVRRKRELHRVEEQVE